MSYSIKFVDGPMSDEQWMNQDLPYVLNVTVPDGVTNVFSGDSFDPIDSIVAYRVVTYIRDIASDKPGWFFAYKESK